MLRWALCANQKHCFIHHWHSVVDSVICTKTTVGKPQNATTSAFVLGSSEKQLLKLPLDWLAVCRASETTWLAIFSTVVVLDNGAVQPLQGYTSVI